MNVRKNNLIELNKFPIYFGRKYFYHVSLGKMGMHTNTMNHFIVIPFKKKLYMQCNARMLRIFFQSIW